MKFLCGLLLSLFLAAAPAYGQAPPKVTNHAFAIGKGTNVAGYTSLLCGSAQLAVGQAAADPICQTMTGDATLSAGGALAFNVVNANVGSFGSATQCVTATFNAKGLVTAASQTTCTVAVGSITGLGTGVASALAVNVGSPNAFVVNGGAGGTPSSLTLTNATGLPPSTGLSVAVPFSKGGCNGTTQQANFDNCAPTATRAGDIIYWNGTHYVTLPGNNSGTNFLQENASGVPSWASAAGSGTVTSVVCNGVTITTTGTCPSPFFATNCTLAASVGSSILTVALKDASGADASASSPCYIPFRNATVTTGSTTFDAVTAALSINTNAVGASLGSVNATAFRFWVVAFDNAGTVVLSLFNASTASQCFGIDEGTVQSSTAMSGSATAAGTYYTPNGTTLSSKAIRILGYVEYGSAGLATAGTYASGPGFIQTFGPGLKRPCEVFQTVYATQTAQTNSATTPTSVLSSSITPKSAANLIRGNAAGGFSSNTSAGGPFVAILALSRGACGAGIVSAPVGTVSALTAAATAGNNAFGSASVSMLDKPNTASAQAYNVCMWNTNAANTATWPQNPGTMTNQIGTFTLDEIMG